MCVRCPAHGAVSFIYQGKEFFMNSPAHGAVLIRVLVGTLRARMARLSTHDPMCGRCPTHGAVSFIYQGAALLSCTPQRAALSPRALLALFEHD